MNPIQPTSRLHERLPKHLAERTRVLSDHDPSGEFVLYWLRTAQRAHDNPALDAALAAADQLGLPVFVYHALSERYPHASDRHHTFILEGALDVQAELKDRGVGTAFHLERPGHRGAHLVTLAQRAALVVTEDLPVPPLVKWTRRLHERVQTPVWVVDTACILPMMFVQEPVDRAFIFRKKYDARRKKQLRAGWSDHPVKQPAFIPSDLPYEPVNLASQSTAELVAQCSIDHSVSPITATRGGTQAGYARWEAFCSGGGLEHYAARRNSPYVDSVSRLSAYLHYGMISPFHLAEQARQMGGKGPEKWLDELLIWRELAHAWCAFQADVHSMEVLPDWALKTLRAHQGDTRHATYTDEQLHQAQTGDRLWDACQRSLLRHGELHNNVRMTWGKQVVQWAASPEQARRLLVELNNRYALDGRDPNSYGGLYWCLGLFDRPFKPEQPILGTVRGRSSAAHEQRIDIEAYEAWVDRLV
jgi:photolyase PhrII